MEIGSATVEIEEMGQVNQVRIREMGQEKPTQIASIAAASLILPA